MKMNAEKENREKIFLRNGIAGIAMFAVWTALVLTVDVQPAGESGTAVGFAAWNTWFHQLTGVHMWIYTVTDWLGLVPVFVCFLFGATGFLQLVTRKSLRKVVFDLRILGIYYSIVIACCCNSR